MPKSKRDRTVSLTVTKKKGLEFKQNLISEIRECLDTHDNLFIISMFNQRNLFLKELRQKWTDSKFLFGKNKVIALALGRDPESEYKENLNKVTPYLVGNVGLLFTNKTKEEVLNYFQEYECPDYARSGNVATEDVTINAGPLTQFQHTMEPQLRKLGMHTSLKKGIVTLDMDFVVCKKGDKLTPEQARLLKLFEYMQATFKVNVKVYWNKNGDYEIIDSTLEAENNENADSQGDESEKEMEQSDDEDKPIKKKLKNRK
ncbi:mRNA turnover 4 -like protein [Brachionus plicatilis]|uniref:Ribosome assembly factor mrt4 n=1 Tax=Brachionus plicatilis TaxID=10195 RepID=A0A3M7PYZ6_BRAPC|nr:mRNA turnover 4 -like protein [Brachionus plicatilis]